MKIVKIGGFENGCPKNWCFDGTDLGKGDSCAAILIGEHDVTFAMLGVDYNAISTAKVGGVEVVEWSECLRKSQETGAYVPCCAG